MPPAKWSVVFIEVRSLFCSGSPECGGYTSLAADPGGVLVLAWPHSRDAVDVDCDVAGPDSDREQQRPRRKVASIRKWESSVEFSGELCARYSRASPGSLACQLH